MTDPKNILIDLTNKPLEEPTVGRRVCYSPRVFFEDEFKKPNGNQDIFVRIPLLHTYDESTWRGKSKFLLEIAETFPTKGALRWDSGGMKVWNADVNDISPEEYADSIMAHLKNRGVFGVWIDYMTIGPYDLATNRVIPNIAWMVWTIDFMKSFREKYNGKIFGNGKWAFEHDSAFNPFMDGAICEWVYDRDWTLREIVKNKGVKDLIIWNEKPNGLMAPSARDLAVATDNYLGVIK